MRCCARHQPDYRRLRGLIPLLLSGWLLLPGSVRAGTPISLHATHAGHVNFVGTAGSLRRGSNLTDACAVDNYDTAALTDLPAGATVRAAYLYWAGSWSDQFLSTQRTPDWDVTLDGAAVTADRQFTEVFSLGFSRYDFFSGMADVTALVAAKGNGLYTFGNLDVNTAWPHCNVQAVLAGWSLIVVYEHPDESNRVVNIFDGFQYYRGGQIAVTATDFEIAASDINGKVGHLTWEGDAENSGSLNGYTEGLTFNGNALLDPLNPVNNQFNSTVNTAGLSDQWGVDLDIYDVTPYLNAGDIQATTVYRSGRDLVLLSAEVISVTNTPLTDLAFTAAPDDPLFVLEPGRIALTLVNNGPSDEPLPVSLTVTLPAGLAYTGTTGSGWTVNTGALPVITWSRPGPVLAGQSLPLEFTVQPDPGAVGSPDLLVSVSGGSFDFNPANDTGTMALNVVLPDAELTSASFTETVADPINGAANPKAIPGATLVCTVTTSNIRAGTVDRNTVEVINPVPANTALYVNTFPGSTTGAVLFVDGPVSSGLRLRRRLIAFSNDGGASFSYRPVPDALGYDPAVTHIRIRPRGIFLGRDISGPSSFSLKFQVMVQ